MTATLRRKLAGADTAAASREMTALRALRLAMARTAGDTLGLALGAIAARQSLRAPDEVSADIAADGLLMLLDCAGTQTGAAVLSLPLVSSLIQQQTMGRVADRAPDPRPFTDTDALICAPFLEDCLRMAADIAEAECDRACLADIRFGARAGDARALCLALRAQRYRVYAFTLDIAEGRRQGDLALILPDPAPVAPDPRQSGADRDPDQSPLMQVEADLTAVLARLRLPLDRLNALRVGDLVPVARERVDETALVAPGGAVIARGRLGQMNGQRAVRLMAPAPVPRATGDAALAQFDPLPRKAPAPRPEGNEDMVDIAALARFSPDDAAKEIGALAGLSEEDMQALSLTPAPGEEIEGRPV